MLEFVGGTESLVDAWARDDSASGSSSWGGVGGGGETVTPCGRVGVHAALLKEVFLLRKTVFLLLGQV